VILATGGFQTPSVPAFAKQFSADVIQLTTETYKKPSQIPAGKLSLSWAMALQDVILQMNFVLSILFIWQLVRKGNCSLKRYWANLRCIG
jgi:hypothetical protein